MASASIDPSRVRALAAELRDFVLRARSVLDAEIRSYPTPILRCDAQFNHAYEQRSRLAAVLQRINSATDSAVDADQLLRAMAELLALPSIDDSSEEHALRARVADALASTAVYSPGSVRAVEPL
jgi:hypothetical protein